MVRRPAVAGQFYPGDKSTLLKELEEMIPECAEKVDAMGIIAPHAGYMYSGAVAGEVYAKLKPKSTYVILCPNHSGYGAQFASSAESWSTPLGTVEVDNELLAEIMAKAPLVKEDRTAHVFEHSAEVQVPFIQKISPGARIVPITIQFGNAPELAEVADAIASAILKKRHYAVIVASSDMTHYESRSAAGRKDRMAIEKVLELDAEGLLETVEKQRITMCGYVPSAIMLMSAKKMGATKAELVKYTDSGEATGDTSQVVGYAGIIVY